MELTPEQITKDLLHRLRFHLSPESVDLPAVKAHLEGVIREYGEQQHTKGWSEYAQRIENEYLLIKKSNGTNKRT